MLGLHNEREWESFCDKVLMQPQLAADPRFDANPSRSENRTAATRIILDEFGKLSTQQVTARLEDAQIPNAHVNRGRPLEPSGAEGPRALSHRRLAGGPSRRLPPGRCTNSFEYRMDPVPLVGQHNDAIPRELGRLQGQLAAFRPAGPT